MARRVYLHVGTMKAATTYLQNLFDENRDLLARHGILWQGSRLNHGAVQDLQGSPMLPPHEKGSWDRFCREIAAWEDDVLVSMELLARLPQRRIERFTSGLAAEEVQVILTARDLTRVVPSHWQETTQNRGTLTWTEYVERVVGCDPREADELPIFWQHHYLPAIVRSWSAVAGPTQVHLVTLPRNGGDSSLVWQRFAQVLGVPPAGATEPTFGNASLGAASAEVMRRVNGAVDGLDWQRYRWGFKAALAKQILSRRAGREPRPALSREQYERLAAISRGMVADLGDLGIQVVGDLDDLRPSSEPPASPLDPSLVSDADLLDAALHGLAGLGGRVGQLHIERSELRRENRRLKDELARRRIPLSHRVRTRLRAFRRH